MALEQKQSEIRDDFFHFCMRMSDDPTFLLQVKFPSHSISNPLCWADVINSVPRCSVNPMSDFIDLSLFDMRPSLHIECLDQADSYQSGSNSHHVEGLFSPLDVGTFMHGNELNCLSSLSMMMISISRSKCRYGAQARS